MTISGGSALSKDDIDRMVKDAEQYAEEDARRRESVETRNQADSLVYSTEKFLSENDEKLPEDVKTEVQGDVDALKAALQGDDEEAVKTAFDKLVLSQGKLGEAIYSSSGDAGEPSAESGESTETPESSDEDIVDAEVVEDEPSTDPKK